MVGAIFVTGSDTGVGKTLVSAILLHALRRMGWRALGMKPVASGCRLVGGDWRNDDAEMLLAACSEPRPEYALVNPYALPEPTAPEIAASRTGVTVELERIRQAYTELTACADWVVVEGVGGWMAPIAANIDQADLVMSLGGVPVVLVVGVRLGCINHARLSERAIVGDGCRVIGWVANMIDPGLAFADATLAILARVLDAPCLGTIGYQDVPNPDALSHLLVTPFAQRAGLSPRSTYAKVP